jgi:hypothetical protein
MFRRVLLLVCAASVAGCASSKTSASGAAATPRDRTIMDSSELVGSTYANAYAAVMAARPEWLRAPIGPPPPREPAGGRDVRFPTAGQVARATNGGTTIGVFVQGGKQALGISYLNTLPVHQVAWLKHLSPSEAMSVYGPEWAWGAIVVGLRQ